MGRNNRFSSGYVLAGCGMTPIDRIVATDAEIKALRADAMRYRYLRDNMESNFAICQDDGGGWSLVLSREADAAITAIQEELK